MQGVRCPAVEVDGGVTGLYYKLTLLSMLTILGDGYTYYGVLRAPHPDPHQVPMDGLPLPPEWPLRAASRVRYPSPAISVSNNTSR